MCSRKMLARHLGLVNERIEDFLTQLC